MMYRFLIHDMTGKWIFIAYTNSNGSNQPAFQCSLIEACIAHIYQVTDIKYAPARLHRLTGMFNMAHIILTKDEVPKHHFASAYRFLQ